MNKNQFLIDYPRASALSSAAWCSPTRRSDSKSFLRCGRTKVRCTTGASFNTSSALTVTRRSLLRGRYARSELTNVPTWWNARYDRFRRHPCPHRNPFERKLVDSVPEDVRNRMEELDQAFFAYPDDLTGLLFAYVASYPEVFGPSPRAGDA